MSGTTSNLAPAGHDGHLYDPNLHDNQIVAVYETMAQANAARDALVSAGVDTSAVQVIDQASQNVGGGASGAYTTDDSFWGSIKSLFAPDEDTHAYGHAIAQGHAMVIVSPAQTANRSHIIEVLEMTGPIDFDAKLEEWRQSGYNYTPTGSTLHSETATGMATGTGSALGAVTGAVAGAASDVKTAFTGTGTGTGTGTMDDKLQVIQERLRVGKREVAAGAVRVRSYVVERPVEEQVRLHEERINVVRTPVDRAVTGAEAGLFQERTIEARATSEEAVVSKEARVVEEIGINKQASDRTETVRDTVRETKVEVEDTTATAASTTTPGVTSSGMNSPRK